MTQEFGSWKQGYIIHLGNAEGALGKDGEKTRNTAKRGRMSEATSLVEIRITNTEISA